MFMNRRVDLAQLIRFQMVELIYLSFNKNMGHCLCHRLAVWGLCNQQNRYACILSTSYHQILVMSIEENVMIQDQF
jgi:hypothetical protein